MTTVRSSGSLAARRSAALGLLMVSLLLGVAPAQAQEPPPLGEPTDHFAGRRAIGQEGAITLGNGSANTGLNLRRLALRQTTPPGDPAPPDETLNPPQLTGATSAFTTTVTDGPTGFGEADLDLITTSDGVTHPSLEPGLIVAGTGVTSAAGCSGGGLLPHLVQADIRR